MRIGTALFLGTLIVASGAPAPIDGPPRAVPSIELQIEILSSQRARGRLTVEFPEASSPGQGGKDAGISVLIPFSTSIPIRSDRIRPGCVSDERNRTVLTQVSGPLDADIGIILLPPELARPTPDPSTGPKSPAYSVLAASPRRIELRLADPVPKGEPRPPSNLIFSASSGIGLTSINGFKLADPQEKSRLTRERLSSGELSIGYQMEPGTIETRDAPPGFTGPFLGSLALGLLILVIAGVLPVSMAWDHGTTPRRGIRRLEFVLCVCGMLLTVLIKWLFPDFDRAVEWMTFGCVACLGVFAALLELKIAVVAQVRILFVATNPVDSPPLDLGEELRNIFDEISLSDHSKAFQVIEVPAARKEDVRRKLMNLKPDIVHFCGHGDDQGRIYLRGEGGRHVPLDGKAIAYLFRDHDRPLLRGQARPLRLVSLNACYSEKMAPVIVQDVDCVVGMSTAVEDEVAIDFARNFYMAIAGAQSVKSAFDNGTRAIGHDEDPAMPGGPELDRHLGPTEDRSGRRIDPEDIPRIKSRVDPATIYFIPRPASRAPGGDRDSSVR